MPSVQTSAFLQESHAKNPGGQPVGDSPLPRRARGRCRKKKKEVEREEGGMEGEKERKKGISMVGLPRWH